MASRAVHGRAANVTVPELQVKIDDLKLRVHDLRMLVGWTHRSVLALRSGKDAKVLAVRIRAECERLGVAEGLFEGSNNQEAKA